MKKSFLNAKEPFITAMVQGSTAEEDIRKIKEAIESGATAIGLQMHPLKKEERTKEILTEIIASAGDAPVYFTNYRMGLNQGMSDEELMEGLLFGLECGATLVDVMGDTFQPSPEELAMDEKAVEKQINFIKEVHKRGGEVLMSSHINEFRDEKRVLEIALEHIRRGTDVVKIVTGASTQEEQIKNLAISNALKQKIDKPFLFLSNGEYNIVHRVVGPAFGVSMWLCFKEYDSTTYVGPPLIDEVVKFKKALKI